MQTNIFEPFGGGRGKMTEVHGDACGWPILFVIIWLVDDWSDQSRQVDLGTR